MSWSSSASVERRSERVRVCCCSASSSDASSLISWTSQPGSSSSRHCFLRLLPTSTTRCLSAQSELSLSPALSECACSHRVLTMPASRKGCSYRLIRIIFRLVESEKIPTLTMGLQLDTKLMTALEAAIWTSASACLRSLLMGIATP